MAIAMHCNLRPPDVATVVVGFNYGTHNAPDYKFNTSVTPFGFVDSRFFSAADILTIGGNLPVFWPIFSLRMRRNCYFRASG